MVNNCFCFNLLLLCFFYIGLEECKRFHLIRNTLTSESEILLRLKAIQNRQTVGNKIKQF